MSSLLSILLDSSPAHRVYELWTDARFWLWVRLGVCYPARPGWRKRVHEVTAVPLWQEQGENGLPGLVGLPLEWTLLVRQPDGSIATIYTVCAWSGESISGLAPLTGDPDRPVDATRWGVRCARCGVAIHCRHAGMKFGTDVPSCPPCRSTVRSVIQRS